MRATVGGRGARVLVAVLLAGLLAGCTIVPGSMLHSVLYDEYDSCLGRRDCFVGVYYP